MADADAPAWPEPRANPDLVGHAAAEAALLDAWHSGRMAHAWLITGPKGAGKATLAYRFARFVLSRNGNAQAAGLFEEQPASLFVPPDDPVFARVAAESHRDLVSVQPSWDDRAKRRRSEIVVADIQKLGKFFAMTAEGVSSIAMPRTRS
jgi:DNA polymerase-3 subunit delta'